MRLASILLGLVAAASWSLPAAAHEVVYEANLSGGAVSPPSGSLGTGFVRITIDLDVLTMRVQASFSGLTGATTAAHIHCCLVQGGPANVVAATQIPAPASFPLGVTAGAYDQTLDISVASSYNPQFVTDHGTLGDALDAMLNGLSGGTAYFDVHTSASAGGEIRGNLRSAPTVESLPFGFAVALAVALPVAAALRARARAVP